jgi:hypothetical protein
LFPFQLSISEYRQRKQRNSSTELNCGGVDGDGGPRHSPACRGSRGRTDSSSSSSSSVSSDDDTPSAGVCATSKNLLLDSSPTLSALPLFLHTDTLDDKRGVKPFSGNMLQHSAFLEDLVHLSCITFCEQVLEKKLT